MNLFKKPKTPPPLDVGKVAGQQNQQNQQNIQQQAQYNRPNQYGPFGSVTWKQNPDGSFSQETSISGDELAYRDHLKALGTQGMEAGLQSLYNQPGVGRVSSDPQGLMGLGTAGIYGFNPTAGSMAAFQKADDYWTQVEEPRMARQREQLETKLKTQGFSNTDQAYREGMDDLASQQGEARGRFVQNAQNQFFNQDRTLDTDAWSRATGLFGLGQSEAQRLFGEDLSGAGLDLNRASTLANLSRGIAPTPMTTPGVSSFNGINVPNVDLTSLYQQQQNDLWKQYGANMQNYNNMWNTIGNVAGTVAGFGMPGGGTLGGNLIGQGLAGLGWGLNY